MPDDKKPRILIDAYLDWVKDEHVPIHEDYAIDLFSVTTAPWPRRSAAGLFPSVSASAFPRAGLLMSKSVIPAVFRISKTGTPSAINPARPNIGRSGTSVAPNGISEGVWQ